MPCLWMLKFLESRKDEKLGVKEKKPRNFNYYHPMKAIVFAVFITVFSLAMSVGMTWLLLYLDYNGPNH